MQEQRTRCILSIDMFLKWNVINTRTCKTQKLKIVLFKNILHKKF